MKNLLIISMMFLLAGCIHSRRDPSSFSKSELAGFVAEKGIVGMTENRRRILLDEAQKRYNFSEDEMEGIKKRTIRIGDRKEKVRFSWGNPDRSRKSTSRYGQTEWWHFDSGASVSFDTNGKVDYISN